MKKVLILLALLFPSLSQGAEPCISTWNDVLRTGTERGLRFQISLHQGRGECFRHKNAFLASASNEDGISCNLKLFDGAKISAGWKIRVIGDTSIFESETDPKGGAPILRISAEAGKTTTFIPKSVEVSSGTKCVSWIDAFIFN